MEVNGNQAKQLISLNYNKNHPLSSCECFGIAKKDTWTIYNKIINVIIHLHSEYSYSTRGFLLRGFISAFDNHTWICFSLLTVMTSTILQGSVGVGINIPVPCNKMVRKFIMIAFSTRKLLTSWVLVGVLLSTLYQDNK